MSPRSVLGDPPEEVAGARAVQVLQRFGDRDLDVLLGELVGRGVGIDRAEPLDHRVAAAPGERQVVALGVKLGKQVSVHGVGRPSVGRRSGRRRRRRPARHYDSPPWRTKTSSTADRGRRRARSRKSCWSRRSRSTACAASTELSAARPRAGADPQVALRPEPFGALAYHYGNRRLVFLKHPDMVAVAQQLGDHPSLAATLEACDIAPSRWPIFATAFESLNVIGDRP